METADASITYYDTLNEQAETETDISKLRNISTLQKNYYAVDKKTGMKEDMFNIDKLLNENVHINIEENGPKILIFHTHGSEMYLDSKNENEGVIGAGEYLKELLEDKYGIEVMHFTQKFDVVNGKLQRDGAYERAEPVISHIIEENPSIQLVIDLHRDGVNENLRLVSNIDGDKCAKVMFFNGLCRKWTNGKLEDISSLKNPYINTNLALSLKMQMKMNELYPNLTRKIYLNAYRYSLHMKDKSMLIELGAQTNTVEEVHNSIEKLAEVLYEVTVK
ncbi:MAG: stage II sporulation protein P [Lachnospirales bacterium]